MTRLQAVCYGLAMLCALALLPVVAFGQEAVRAWEPSSSYIRLQPTEAPGAVAEVEFRNEAVHTDSLDTFTLSVGGFSVEVTALLGRGDTPDEMTVIPPAGYIAVPPTISVPEGKTMVITIYSSDGVGM